ncbi:MAG: hypothetical protein ACI9DF_005035, partial [Verrucomicrobiales bacterium]
RVFISEMLEIAVPGFLQPSVTFRSSLLLAWLVSSWTLDHHSLGDPP